MIRWVARILLHNDASFHWLGSEAPETCPTDTGIAVLMTSYCWSTRATVGAMNHETYPSTAVGHCTVDLVEKEHTFREWRSASSFILSTAMWVLPEPVSRAMMRLRCRLSSSNSC